MNSRPIWKVCRVTDIHSARLAVEAGADMIGMHVISALQKSPTDVFRRIATELAVHYPSVSPILVTRITQVDRLLEALIESGARGFQLHAPLDPFEFEQITSKVRLSLGGHIRSIAVIAAEEHDSEHRAAQYASMTSERPDYLLIDSSWRGGTGLKAPPDRMKAILSKTSGLDTLIAGGLDSGNVRTILDEFNPSGVDVQSGLEMAWPDRPKDPEKLLAFGHKVRQGVDVERWRFPVRPMVGASLTDVPPSVLHERVKALARTDIDLMHLDHSDGSLAPGFVRAPYQAAERLRNTAPCLPYDLHLFIQDLDQVAAVVQRYLELNPLLRITFLHLSQFTIDTPYWVQRFTVLNGDLGTQSGLAIHAPGFDQTSLQTTIDRVVTPFRIRAINLVTHSHHHGLDTLRERDLPLLRLLRDHSTDGDGYQVGVDRDIDEARLAVLAQANPNLAISGRFLHDTNHLQEGITTLRSLLSEK